MSLTGPRRGGRIGVAVLQPAERLAERRAVKPPDVLTSSTAGFALHEIDPDPRAAFRLVHRRRTVPPSPLSRERANEPAVDRGLDDLAAHATRSLTRSTARCAR